MLCYAHVNLGSCQLAIANLTRKQTVQHSDENHKYLLWLSHEGTWDHARYGDLDSGGQKIQQLYQEQSNGVHITMRKTRTVVRCFPPKVIPVLLECLVFLFWPPEPSVGIIHRPYLKLLSGVRKREHQNQGQSDGKGMTMVNLVLNMFSFSK